MLFTDLTRVPVIHWESSSNSASTSKSEFNKMAMGYYGRYDNIYNVKLLAFTFYLNIASWVV